MRGPRSGNTVVVVVLLLAIAAFGLGSILLAVLTFVRHTENNHYYEQALLLADAGISAALVELNNDGDGNFSMADSRKHFANTDAFAGTDWGFSTLVTDTNDNMKHIASTGTYRGVTAFAEMNASVQGIGRMLSALYSLAIYAGNSSSNATYIMSFGGIGAGADYVFGDVHANGGILREGDALLPYPEVYLDVDGDGRYTLGEPYSNSYAFTDFTNPITPAELAAYRAGVDLDRTYRNSVYDMGEPFVDSIGNSVWDPWETFTDANGDGFYTFGEHYIDANGNGSYDEGETFTDMGNGIRDEGEEYDDLNGNGAWDPGTPGHYEGAGWNQRWVAAVPGEPFDDMGNGVFDGEEGEAFEDRDGRYNLGELFVDDRNSVRDYGTTATELIDGMPSPGINQLPADGGDPYITPPNLSIMYYDLPKTTTKPEGADDDWGHDINVAAAPFNANGQVTDQSNPAHIFVKNPSWDYAEGGAKNVGGRDDYFITDPTDPTFEAGSQKLSVLSNGNEKVYFVDGNLFLHDDYAFDFQFRYPNTRITIVAKGNIRISDEITFNGGRTNSQDALCLIAMTDPADTNGTSGNVIFGDPVYGTGGDVHSMLYAENDFLASAMDTSGQPYLSIFGNMSAGDAVQIDRSGELRTRLDVTLDKRIRNGINVPPGLPPGQADERGVYLGSGWEPEWGTWSSFSRLK